MEPLKVNPVLNEVGMQRLLQLAITTGHKHLLYRKYLAWKCVDEYHRIWTDDEGKKYIVNVDKGVIEYRTGYQMIKSYYDYPTYCLDTKKFLTFTSDKIVLDLGIYAYEPIPEGYRGLYEKDRVYSTPELLESYGVLKNADVIAEYLGELHQTREFYEYEKDKIAAYFSGHKDKIDRMNSVAAQF